MKNFLVKISPAKSDPQKRDVSVEGDLACLEDNKIVIKHAGRRHVLVELSDPITVHTLPGNIIQIYARVRNGALFLSNAPHLLIEQGEEIEIKTQTLLQHLGGDNYPLNNYLLTIEELIASSIYEYNPAGSGHIKFKKTSLVYDPNHGDKLFQNHLVDIYNNYTDTVAVLLSAGYDSRLNLSAALHCGKKVIAYHEYVSQPDLEVVENVAKAVGVELILLNRSDFKQPLKTKINEMVPDLNVSYRTSLVKWAAFSDFVKEQNPGIDLLGMGAEAHKGVYYGQLEDIRKELPGLMYGYRRQYDAFETLGVQSYHDFANEAFEDLLTQAQGVYDDFYAQIDYMHYHVKICNGFGGRNHLFFRGYDIDFPNLYDDLIGTTFSMNYQLKEGCGLAKRAIAAFTPELSDVGVLSTNAFALRERPFKTVLADAVKSYKKRLSVLRKKKDVKKWKDLPLPKNDLTKHIYEDMMGEQIFRSSNRVYRYLSFLENEYHVSFKLV